MQGKEYTFETAAVLKRVEQTYHAWLRLRELITGGRKVARHFPEVAVEG